MRNKKKLIRSVTVPNSIDFFEEIIVKMKGDGYEPVVVTSPGALLDEFKERHKHIKTIAVQMERHISLKNDIVSLWRMIKVFAKEKPYIVHSMTPKAGLLSMVAAKLTGVPVRIHTFTGLVWPTAVGTKRKILMATDKILCACATHIIPEGEGVKNDLQAYITKKPMKVLGYGNARGVDMERFDPKRFQNVSKLQKDSSVFSFLFVGRIVADKGINELVEAFVRLKDEFQKVPESSRRFQGLRLILVGRYENDLDPIKHDTLRLIENTEEISAIGPKYGDDLLKELVKCDCFVMPSYREGFPNTVLEAGAMGLPQIVTDINGSREIVCDDLVSDGFKEFQKVTKGSVQICKNGLIIPSKNVEALYEAMQKMIEDQEMREQMAKNARPMIESRFEKNFVQGCQIQYYKEILK